MINIILTESQVNRLFENKMLRGKFNNDLKAFLKDLSSNPINASLPKSFSENGITKDDLINKLIRNGMISKKEGFDEVSDGNNKKFSQHHLSFTFHGEDYENKKDKLYNELFSINEDGGAMGGGALGCGNLNVGTSDVSGGIVTPFGGVQRRKGYSPKKSSKDSGDVTKQTESTVDMSDALKRDTKKGISMNRK